MGNKRKIGVREGLDCTGERPLGKVEEGMRKLTGSIENEKRNVALKCSRVGFVKVINKKRIKMSRLKREST